MVKYGAGCDAIDDAIGHDLGWSLGMPCITGAFHHTIRVCRARSRSPKFAQNRGFPLKLPENCMILKKSWAASGLSSQGPPHSASGHCVGAEVPRSTQRGFPRILNETSVVVSTNKTQQNN